MLLALSQSWRNDSATEQLAANCAARLLPDSVNCVYLAFDWHYAFERINADQQTVVLLQQQLAEYRNGWLGACYVVTVCQHPDALKYAALFSELGITDVYIAGGAGLAAPEQKLSQVRFRVFPLYVAKQRVVDNAAEAFWQAFFSNDLAAVRPSDVAGIPLPGDAALWQQLADSGQPMAIRAQALKQLQLQYGEQVLLSDIITLFCRYSITASARCGLLQHALDRYLQHKEPQTARFIATSVQSLTFLAPAALQNWLGMPQVSETIAGLSTAWARESTHRPTYLVPDTGKPKLRYAVLGTHANRMPLAYADYQPFLTKDLVHEVNLADADVICISYIKDLEQLDAVQRQLLQAGSKPLVVLSEEPFWDVNWGGHFAKTNDAVTLSDGVINYRNVNHLTSNIFNFDRLPYFITTEDHYFVRYCHLFQRNIAVSSTQWAANWHDAEVECALIAEKRLGEKFDLSYPALDIFGLCRLRSLLAQHYVDKNSALVAGMGWSKGPKRQRLADWHLDKLALLDGRCRFVSALENTHVNNYITEKVFDAYAVGAIPIYYAGPSHRIWDLVQPNSLINLYGLTFEQALQKITDFSVTPAFVDAYIRTQQQLAKLFSKPENLHLERSRVAAEVISQLTT